MTAALEEVWGRYQATSRHISGVYLSEIAHEHGALVVVDASQSVGAVRTRAKEDDVDLIAFGGQKWTLAPSAGGGFFIKNNL